MGVCAANRVLSPCTGAYGRYLHGNNLHRLVALDARVDNADQRVQQDADEFTALFVTLVTGQLTAIVEVCAIAVALLVSRDKSWS